MSIRTKFLITISAAFMCTAVVLFGISYTVLKWQYVRSIKSSGLSNTLLNKKILAGFLSNNDETVLRLTGNKAIGTIASRTNLTEEEYPRLRAALSEQLSDAIGFQIDNPQYQTETLLFFNDELPASQLFVPEQLNGITAGTRRIYSDRNIKSDSWYRFLQTARESYSIFTLPETDKLYCAYTLRNTYYTGTYPKGGLGTLVIAVPIHQMEELVYFYPLTTHSSFAVLNSKNETLFSDLKQQQVFTDPIFIEYINRISVPENGITVDLRTADMICTIQGLPKGLKLIYLTPVSDINRIASKKAMPVIGIICTGFLILLPLMLIVTRAITEPIIKLSHEIAAITDTRTINSTFFSGYTDSELKILCTGFQQLIETANTLIKNTEKETALRKDMELQALQAQINPHFIFNAMDMVNWMALTQGKNDIADLVSAIAEVMRYSITDAGKRVPLAVELDNIEKLMYIYQHRFPDALFLETAIPNELSTQLLIPKFIVQPLVENAVKHGKDLRTAKLHIRIEAEHHKSGTIVRVIDDGAGCDPDILNRYVQHEAIELPVQGGFGVRNVNERIKLSFASGSGLYFYYNTAHFFTAEILLREPVI